MAEWFDIGVNYRQIFNIKKNRWKYENRPHISGTFKYTISDITISDRSRFEYRNMEDVKDDWRYRNKLTLTLPKYTSLEIQPYIADEIFYSFDKQRMVKNRAYAGLTFKIIKELKGEIFYLYETDKSGKKWVSFNTLGTKLKLVF